MPTLAGHENLKQKKVIGFSSDGKAIIDFGNGETKKYNILIGPTGTIYAEPMSQEEIDQQVARKGKRTHAEKMQGLDQNI